MNLSSFYRSKEWENLSKLIRIERVNSNGDLCCEDCGRPIVNAYEAICHHVKELTETNVHDVNISLNPMNIQVLCRSCHNRIHARFGFNPDKRTRNVYIVWGSPCAGKARYVEEAAGSNDLIVDIDKLYEAMSLGRSNAVKSNVLSVYRQLIDMVKTRNGRWNDAYIIRTLPLQIDRELILRECGGGELIHIDTPKDECLLEAEKRGGDWVKWTEEYWRKFQPSPTS